MKSMQHDTAEGTALLPRTCRSMSFMCRTKILATRFCCLGQQCISKDKLTGSSDVVKAHSAMALATCANVMTVQNVCPARQAERVSLAQLMRLLPVKASSGAASDSFCPGWKPAGSHRA